MYIRFPKRRVPLSSIRKLLLSIMSSLMSAVVSWIISVISSSAVENRKLGKPREGDEELDGEDVLRRS